jgi:UDP-N-acetylmuramoyl-tripeptide--D-alanyl-D-alanine ligase
MLASIASLSRNTLKTEGNLNNLIGLPLTLLRMRPEHRLVIVEIGTSSPGEIARLSAIAEPDVGLITNIGPAHLEGLGSLDAVREEKGALFAAIAGRGTAILNRDDPAIGILAERWRGNRVTFGLAPASDVTARRIEKAGPAALHFDLVIEGDAFPVRLASPGRHNLMNALAAAAAAAALGIDPRAIAEGLSSFRPVPGRTEIRTLGNGAFLILDAYNANPASVREALLTLKDLRGGGRTSAILGDMLELGEQGVPLHEEIGTLLAETGVDHLFLKGTLIRKMAASAVRAGIPEEEILFFEDPERVIDRLRRRLREGDWILIKGSRKMKMEEVAEAILDAFDEKTQTV